MPGRVNSPHIGDARTRVDAVYRIMDVWHLVYRIDSLTYTVAKTLSDATWWLLLYWLPDFYKKTFGLSGWARNNASVFSY